MIRLSKLLVIALLFFVQSKASTQTLIHYWNFNNSASEATLLAPTSSLTGGASITHIAGGSSIIQITSNTTGQGFETTNPNARNANAPGSHLRFNNPIGGALEISLPTTGYNHIVVKYGTRRSGSGAGQQFIAYSTNGTNFIPFDTILPVDGNPVVDSIDFSTVAAANNNVNFKIRITFAQGPGGTEGNNRFDNITVEGNSMNIAQTLLHYWNFNNSTSQVTLLAPTSSVVSGSSLSHIAGGISAIPITGNTTGQGFETTNPNARNGDAAGSHLRFNNPIGGALEISLPTTGYNNIIVKYANRRSGSGAGQQFISYSTNGTTFIPFDTILPADGNPVLDSIDFSSVTAANNNADFKIRITFAQGPGGTEGNNRFDNITVEGNSTGGPDVLAPGITFHPLNHSVNIPVNVTPVITFDEDVRLISNAAIDNSNVDAIIELRLNNAAGAVVPFDAGFSGRAITIVPVAALLNGQQYYLSLKANTIEDLSDNAIALTQSATFTTITLQAVFNAGDLVPVAYRMNASGTDDEVALLTFVTIFPGTQINFTDAKYTDNTAPQCPGGLTWTAPAEGVTAGTVIRIKNDANTVNIGTLSGSGFGLSSGGDQFIVYTGTNAAPAYITALSSNAWLTANTGCSGSESKRPAALTDGISSIQFSTANGSVSGNTANAYYNGITTGTNSELRAAILDPANWTGAASGTAPQTWPAWNFPGSGGGGGSTMPTIAFDKKFASVKEDTGSVTVKLILTNPAVSSVKLVVKGAPFSNATNADFTLATQTLHFTGASSPEQTVTLPIIDDAVDEQDEYFVLSLEDTTGLTISGTPYFTVYIRDNDRKAPLATKDIELNYVSSFDPSPVTGSTTEIVVYDSASKRLFMTSAIQDRLDIADFSDPANITLVKSVNMSVYGGITSVAVHKGIVAVASPNANEQADGSVVFFNTNGDFQKQVTVGALPDMITFTPDGTKIMTANEGQPNNAYTVDPEGSISIIDISGGIASLTQSNVSTLLFTSFNAQESMLRASGVRKLKQTSTLSQDFEPEYVTVSPDSKKAWATLQENNAIAEIDLQTATITAVWAMGTKDMNAPGNGFDASDNSGYVHLSNYPVKAFYIPDGIANYSIAGINYLITANEGDEKEYAGLTERTTIGAVNLDSAAFPHGAWLKEDQNAGRLRITSLSGDTDGDGDFDELHCAGSRSFTIWNADTKTKVWDSGDDFERITSTDPAIAAIFNADNENNQFKSRSRAKGPEPEGVTIASISGKVFAFISLERVGGVMVYDVTDAGNPKFVDYKNSRSTTSFAGDHAPEGIIYVSPLQSPDGKGYIIIANEISGTVSTYQVKNNLPLPVTLISFTAAAEYENVRLNWTTAAEINNEGFEIERSVQSSGGWQKIAFVAGSGNSNSVLHYDLTDEKAFTEAGNNELYYRLKQVDFDGRFVFSNIISVTKLSSGLADPGSNSFSAIVYPNPFTKALFVQLETKGSAHVRIELSDITSRIMMSRFEETVKGKNIIPVSNDDTLRAGIYFLSVEVNGNKQVRKLVKQ